MNEKTQYRRMLFEIYCLVMLFLLFLQRSPHASGGYLETLRGNLNLVPGETIGRFLAVWESPAYHRAAIINLVGNVVMFVPLGFGLPWVNPRLRRLWKTLLVSAGIIIAVELVQLVTLLGRCDVDDLILNLIGILIGYLIWRIVAKRVEREE